MEPAIPQHSFRGSKEQWDPFNLYLIIYIRDFLQKGINFYNGLLLRWRRHISHHIFSLFSFSSFLGAELALAGSAPTVLEDLSGLAGQEVSVPCSVDVATCGDFHSVKWYRESQRVFVYSELANLERSEGSLTNRYLVKFQWSALQSLYWRWILVNAHCASSVQSSRSRELCHPPSMASQITWLDCISASSMPGRWGHCTERERERVWDRTSQKTGSSQ